MISFFRSYSFPVLGLAAVLAVGTAWFSSSRLEAQEPAGLAAEAPGWKLQDLDGNEVSSEAFKGKVVVVDFWATWCGPCVAEIPGYIAMQKKYGPESLAIVGISLDRAGPAAVKKFAQAKGMNYTIVMGDEQVAEAFGGIEAIPTTFLINREGRIVHRKTGAMAHEEYEKFVRQALK